MNIKHPPYLPSPTPPKPGVITPSNILQSGSSTLLRTLHDTVHYTHYSTGHCTLQYRTLYSTVLTLSGLSLIPTTAPHPPPVVDTKIQAGGRCIIFLFLFFFMYITLGSSVLGESIIKWIFLKLYISFFLY